MGKSSYRVNTLFCDAEGCIKSFEQQDLEPMKKLIKMAKTAGWKVNKKRKGGKVYCPEHVPVKIAPAPTEPATTEVEE